MTNQAYYKLCCVATIDWLLIGINKKRKTKKDRKLCKNTKKMLLAKLSKKQNTQLVAS